MQTLNICVHKRRCFVLISFMQRNSLHFSSLNLVCKTRLYTIRISMSKVTTIPLIFLTNYIYIYICIFFSRKHTRSSTSNAEIGNIENEYIRNLQQQIYFLELEANYLYPFYRIWKIKLQALSIGAAKIWMKDYTHINPMLTHLNSQILVFSDAVGKYCDSFIIIYPLLQQPEENKHVKPQVRSVEQPRAKI